jgi:hypothetical protein
MTIKKHILLYSSLVIATVVNAQSTTTTAATEDPTLKSKKGTPILPESGEYALGVAANPFLGYVGNFFHGTATSGSPAFATPGNPLNNIALFGKKMLPQGFTKTAYRARLLMNLGTLSNRATIAQDTAFGTALDPKFVTDVQTIKRNDIVIAAGKEWRRGKGRVQGIYGFEGIVNFSTLNYKYTYGNTMDSINNAPLTTNLGNNNIVAGVAPRADIRKVSEKTGTTFGLGARGFVGVEYFFAPKISIGGEFGYTLGYSYQGKGTVTTEQWESVTAKTKQVTQQVYNNNGIRSFGLGLDNLGGSINLLFYF